MELGELMGKFAEQQADEILMHEDVKAWGAPSECHKKVAWAAKMELTKLENELGITFDELVEKVEGKDLRFIKIFNEVVGRIVSRDSMFSL